MTVEPSYFTETLPQRPQSIQLVIPGPPDPPEIFLKSVSPEEFVIEWGEPRLYGGVRVRGYQVHFVVIYLTTVKPVLATPCIQRLPVLSDHFHSSQ